MKWEDIVMIFVFGLGLVISIVPIVLVLLQRKKGGSVSLKTSEKKTNLPVKEKKPSAPG